jgi:hypothetical protein
VTWHHGLSERIIAPENQLTSVLASKGESDFLERAHDILA